MQCMNYGASLNQKYLSVNQKFYQTIRLTIRKIRIRIRLDKCLQILMKSSQSLKFFNTPVSVLTIFVLQAVA